MTLAAKQNLTEEITEKVGDYLTVKQTRKVKQSVQEALERFEAGGFRVLLNQIGERAHFENVHPHRFRRTLATKLAKQGMPVQNIAAILGHSNINTTMRYVFMDTTSVENEYRRYI